MTPRKITLFVDIWYDAQDTNDKGYQHESLTGVDQCKKTLCGSGKKPQNNTKTHSLYNVQYIFDKNAVVIVGVKFQSCIQYCQYCPEYGWKNVISCNEYDEGLNYQRQ